MESYDFEGGRSVIRSIEMYWNGPCSTLNSIYQDEAARRTEINAISTPSQPGNLSEFYARLGKVQEHHNKYPDTGADAIEFEIAALLDEFNPEDYDDEEAVYEDREPSRGFSCPSPLILRL